MKGGGVTPSNPLPDGKYKLDLSGGQNFAAMSSINGIIELYAASTEEGDNINVYSSSGVLRAQNAGERYIATISQIASQYDNFVRVEKVAESGNIADFSQYVELS